MNTPGDARSTFHFLTREIFPHLPEHLNLKGGVKIAFDKGELLIQRGEVYLAYSIGEARVMRIQEFGLEEEAGVQMSSVSEQEIQNLVSLIYVELQSEKEARAKTSQRRFQALRPLSEIEDASLGQALQMIEQHFDGRVPSPVELRIPATVALPFEGELPLQRDNEVSLRSPAVVPATLAEEPMVSQADCLDVVALRGQVEAYRLKFYAALGATGVLGAVAVAELWCLARQ